MFGFALNASDTRRIAWTAVMAFVAVYIPLISGAGQFNSYDQAKSAVLALIPAAIAAVLSAIKNGFLQDESSLK